MTEQNRTPGWIVGLVAIGSALVLWTVVGRDDDDRAAATTTRTAAVEYQWADEVCTIDGYSGRFTNTSGEVLSAELSAVMRDAGDVVARDTEFVVELAAGASAVVRFVWVVDERGTCALETVTRR